MDEPLLTKVFFRHYEAKLEFGNSLRVVGSHEKLGDWNPAKGLDLQTGEGIFPSWLAKPVDLPTNVPVEYKYVVVGKDGELKRWEEIPNNRYVLPSGIEMIVEDDDGHYRKFGRKVRIESSVRSSLVESDSGFDVQTFEAEDSSEAFTEKMDMIEKLQEKTKLTLQDTVVIIALQLPVKIVKDENGQWTVIPSKSLLLPTLHKLRGKLDYRVLYFGWPGVHVDNEDDEIKIAEALLSYDCIPVFPPKREFEEFMSFCDAFLFPVFHDIMTMAEQTISAFTDNQWSSYQQVNASYASVVIRQVHEEDLLWIHDFHLLLLPQYISRKHRRANIGMFLHCPFPSLDVFRTLPVREQLLHGMLCCDMLGFQFFGYARNFMTVVKRVLGLDHQCHSGGKVKINYSGRDIMIHVGHVCFPYQGTLEVLSDPAIDERHAELSKAFEGKTVFACVDRCARLSGLVLKIQAFRQFLKAHPQYQGKAILVQYATYGGGKQEEILGQYLQELSDVVMYHVEGQYCFENRFESGTPDVYCLIDRVSQSDRLALFRRADVMFESSVKDGLNLMPFEFITTKTNGQSSPEGMTQMILEKSGQMILSEFSGCSRVLTGAIRVNPWNTKAMIEACYDALNMSETERHDRFELNYTYTSELSPESWAEQFLCDLRRSRKKSDMSYVAIGFGANMRLLGMDHDFQKINVDEVVWAYKNSRTRVFFLDNEGTLAPDKRRLHREYGAPKGNVGDLQSGGAAPSEQVLELLNDLCKDSRNIVVILAGRDKATMESWFGSVENIGLAAEHGFYYRLPGLTGKQWYCMSQHLESSWKPIAFEVMKQFVARTQGSFVENKGSALVWQYRDADPEFGAWQSQELSSALSYLLFGYPVEVVNGKGYTEVKLHDVNKGSAVAKVLSKLAKNRGEADFVLCLGDDRSDELMFEVINEFLKEAEKTDASTTDDSCRGEQALGNSPMSAPSGLGKKSGGLGGMSGGLGGMSKGISFFPGSIATDLMALGGSVFSEDMAMSGEKRRYFTCTVGKKPSAARFYVDEVDEVSELLAALKNADTVGHASSFTMPASMGGMNTGGPFGRRNSGGRAANTFSGSGKASKNLSSLSFG